jgi:hypothetical protein
MTQEERILKHISDHGSISDFEAVTLLHIGRLASRVHDMRRKGINIIGNTVYGENEYGKYHYTRYSLEG